MDAFAVEFGQISHMGMRRANNQDNLAAVPAANESQFKSQGHVFLVADGMGGHLGGEKASELAVQIVPLTYAKNIGQGPEVALRLGLQDANATINRRGNEAIHFYNMGTTCSVLALRAEGAWIGHVGDSRIYRIRPKTIDQLTFDHSFLWETARLRKVSPERVKDVMHNKIMRCLGPDQVVDIDVEGPHPLRPGDIFLLCSDGLSGPVGDTEMASASYHLNPQEACAFLAALANLRGGPDNISIQVVKLPGKSQGDKGAKNRARMNWEKLARWLPLFLVPGILLAGLFIYGIVANRPRTDFVQIGSLFGAAACTLLGMGGLVASLILRAKGEGGISNTESARIHRKENWNLSKDFVENLWRQVEALIAAGEGVAAVQPTLGELRPKLAATEKALKEGDLQGAFRTLALALPRLEPVMRASHGKVIPAVPLLSQRVGPRI